MEPRTSMNDLVFEALGSNSNLGDFVVCEKQINGYKMRMWKEQSPMRNGEYSGAVQGSTSGLNPSNEYMSALRAVSIQSLDKIIQLLTVYARPLQYIDTCNSRK